MYFTKYGVGITAKKIETTQIHLLSDIIAAVAVHGS